MEWPEHQFYGVHEEVSLWSPAQQVHHAALVIQATLDIVRKLYTDEDPSIVRTGSPTRNALMVLTMGSIPRGKAQAPAAVHSPPEVTRQDIEVVLARLDKGLEEAREREKYLYDLKGKWMHPALGPLSAPQWIRFCRIHTEHHLKIAEEIREALLRRGRGIPRP